MRVFSLVVAVALVGCGGNEDGVDAGADAGPGDAGAVDGAAGDAGEGAGDAAVVRDPYPHACTFSRDKEGDGLYDWIAVYELDEAGRVLRDETDSDGDRTVNFVSVMTYDSEGRLTRRALDENNDGEVDFEYTTNYRADGQIDRTADLDGSGEEIAALDYIYDDDGFLIEMAGDLPGVDTHGRDSRVTIENDDNGCAVRTVIDIYDDGRIEEVTEVEVDEACRQLEVAADQWDDGTLDSVWTKTYDGDGNELTVEEVHAGQTVLDRTNTWENGLLMRQVEVHGTSRDVVTYSYDEAGNLLRIEDDKFDDGLALEVTRYEIDGRGNILYEFIDERGDGHPEDMSAYTYDCWN